MPQQQVIDVTPGSPPVNATGTVQLDITMVKSQPDQGTSGDPRYLRSILNNASPLFENTYALNGNVTTVTFPAGVTTIAVWGPLGSTDSIHLQYTDSGNSSENITFHGQAPLVYPLPNDTWMSSANLTSHSGATMNPVTVIGF